MEESINTGFENAGAYARLHHLRFSQEPSKAAMLEPLYLDWLTTPMGDMLAVCGARHLYMLEFTDRKNILGQFEKLYRLRKRPIKMGRTTITDQIETELEQYGQGNLNVFQTPLMPTGTEFQTATWTQLRAIPHGQTRSYAQLAQMVGRPKAVRAVASANARNGLAIIIPCHRVITSGGELGGYAGGISRKADLLARESQPV